MNGRTMTMHSETMRGDRARVPARDVNLRSACLAYLLLFFCGGLGVHRFYLGYTNSALIMLILTIVAALLLTSGIGLLLFIPIGLWVLADLCLIPEMTRRRNEQLMDSLD